MARALTQRERPAAVAAAVGVRERTVRKWLTRYTGAAEAQIERGHGGRPPIRSLAAPNDLLAVHHLGLTRARGRRRPGRRILLGIPRRVL